MANLTQSLASSIVMSGPQDSTKWGTPMKWGTDKWGNGLNNGNFDLPATVISTHNDLGPFSIDQFGIGLRTSHNDSVTFMQNGIRESLFDGSGKYQYVLAGGATNDENAFVPVYTVVTNSVNSWTLQTNSSSTWVQS